MNAKSSAKNYWLADQYELIDFGEGRKLERFGGITLDRPCPAALNFRKRQADQWLSADLCVDEKGSVHSVEGDRRWASENWRARFDQVQFQLRLTPFGHVGLFPEHAAQWSWLLEQTDQLSSQSPSLLNLFAYTGGASLVLAANGWQVTHVDASEPTVQWARHNAQLSDLSQAPIRWLVEDARVYVARELKRGRNYDAILLDPPSYGHGPKGQAWQIDRDLPPLIQQCCQLLKPHGRLILTGHSEPVPLHTEHLVQMRHDIGQHAMAESSRVTMQDRAGRALDFGWCMRSCTRGLTAEEL